MAANVERVARYNVELDEPLTNQPVPGLLMQNDKLADTVELAVTRAGVAASLTGCTTFGEFERPVDGAKVRCPGTISGGTIKIPLKDQCYKYAGAFALVIRCNDGTRERSLMRLSGYVERGGDGVIIDPSGSIPSYADLEQAIANCNAAAEAATAAKNEILQAKADGEFTGPQGPQGPTGPKGATGPQGATGATPNLTIGTVTTGAAGTEASATITGTDEAPVLNLVIPRGDTGAVDGIDYYAGNPAALGTASPGTVNGVARGNHVHPMPTAGDIPVESGDTATVKSKLSSLETKAEAAETKAEAAGIKADAAVRYDEAQSLTDGQKAQARENLGVTQTSVANYTATLTVAGWTGTAAPYTQEATVAGILASDSPFVDVDMSGLTTTDDMAAAQDAFGLILKATAGAGKITFVASDKPETAMTVKIKVVR